MKRFWDFIMGIIALVIVMLYGSFVMDWDRYNHNRMWR